MTLKEFQKFIDKQDALYRSIRNSSENERILSRTVKLSEELGELCDEILTSMGDQRKNKMKKRNSDNLSQEFADVIITTFILAKAMNVDIPISIVKKIKKMKAKHNKQL